MGAAFVWWFGMDLRRKLTARLVMLAGVLLLAAMWLTALAILEDVLEEVEASSHLAALMLAVSQVSEQGDVAHLRQLIAQSDLRHLKVEWVQAAHLGQLDHGQVASSASLHAWLSEQISAWIPTARPELSVVQYIEVGDEMLVIRADPHSEIEEILTATARTLGLLLVFTMAVIVGTWVLVGRALAPVRELEQGLGRLAGGAIRPELPHFELREFDRVAHAIDSLASSLQQAREAQRALSRQLIALQETERAELARELHDELGQSLAAIGVAAAYVERHAGHARTASLTECAKDIAQQAAHMSAHVRGLLGQLRPHGLEGLGLVDALQELLSGWHRRLPGIVVEQAWPCHVPMLDQVASLAVYRTLQEALTNIQRHSQATRIKVSLREAEKELELCVEDNGRGCADAAWLHASGGLAGMRERAVMAGGTLRFYALKPSGFGLELRVPARNEDASAPGASSW